MNGYAAKVKRDIARWSEAGLVDASTAAALSSDIERNHRGVSLGTVLSTMAMALFSAAILLVVAANWEAMPRLLRVAMLFSIIAAGYVGGALLKLNGRDNLAEGAWVLAATAFGASIALIGQMYHLSGDERQAILVWCIGTALAAAALRSESLTAGAALLAIVWMITHVTSGAWSTRYAPVTYPLLAAALYALAFWTGSRPARDLLMLSLSLFAFFYFWDDENLLVPLTLLAFSAALFLLAHLRPVEAERWFGLGRSLPVHALTAFLMAVGIMQVEYIDEQHFTGVSILALAGIIAALLLAGRENAMLRWLAYAAFIFQLCLLYVVMLGSMLDTAGFFVVGGLVLSALAWIIGRLERRLSAQEAPEKGAAS